MAGNAVKTEKFSLTAPIATIEALEQLSATGLYGSTRAEVAREFIQKGVREAVISGLITLPANSSLNPID